MGVSLRFLVIAALVVALVGSARLSTPATAGADAVSPTRAIQAALKYALNSWMFSPFPRTEGRVACQIPTGGLSQGSVPGWCETRVTKSRKSKFVVVTFTEVWETKRFRSGEVDPSLPFQTSTWAFVETPKYKVSDVARYGDIPPQLVFRLVCVTAPRGPETACLRRVMTRPRSRAPSSSALFRHVHDRPAPRP